MLLAVYIRLALLDCVDAAFVVKLCHEFIRQQNGGVIWVVIQHHRNADRFMDGLVVLIKLSVIGAHIPRRYGHNAVGSVRLGCFGHIHTVLRPVGTGGGNYFYAIFMARFNVCFVDCDLFFLVQCDHLAC